MYFVCSVLFGDLDADDLNMKVFRDKLILQISPISSLSAAAYFKKCWFPSFGKEIKLLQLFSEISYVLNYLFFYFFNYFLFFLTFF